MLGDVIQGKQKDIKRPRRSHNIYKVGFGIEQLMLTSNHLLI